MSKVSPAKKQHTSMRGKQVDMDLLRKRNELTPAVGNAKVNARGDELGPGGEIIRKREAIVQEHYAQAGKVRSDSGRAVSTTEIETTPAEQPTTKSVTNRKPAKKSQLKVEEQLTTAEEELEADEEDWIEDTHGNFTKKGE